MEPKIEEGRRENLSGVIGMPEGQDLRLARILAALACDLDVGATTLNPEAALFVGEESYLPS